MKSPKHPGEKTLASDTIQRIVNELHDTKVAELNDGRLIASRLDELRTAIDEVREFAGSVSALIGRGRAPGAGRGSVRGRRTAAERKPGRPRGGRDGFSPTSFIMEAVREAGKAGVRPRDIIERVREVAPGRHANPASIVSPLLNRLKKRGEVVNRNGRWFLGRG